MGTTMRAAVFQQKGKIALREVARPEPGVGEALIKVTLTTICGTDVHILKGEYPVREGLVVGHEPVGVIEALGPGVVGYQVGDRVWPGAIALTTDHGLFSALYVLVVGAGPCGGVRAAGGGLGVDVARFDDDDTDPERPDLQA